jgi:hypothetical protein
MRRCEYGYIRQDVGTSSQTGKLATAHVSEKTRAGVGVLTFPQSPTVMRTALPF